MSFKSICASLAITACVSHAEKMSLKELMMLQTEMVDHLEENETPNELMWDNMHELGEVGGDMHCQPGYSKVGCCKCVADMHAAEHHIFARPEIPEYHEIDYDLYPVIHGAEMHEADMHEIHEMIHSQKIHGIDVDVPELDDDDKEKTDADKKKADADKKKKDADKKKKDADKKKKQDEDTDTDDEDQKKKKDKKKKDAAKKKKDADKKKKQDDDTDTDDEDKKKSKDQRDKDDDKKKSKDQRDKDDDKKKSSKTQDDRDEDDQSTGYHRSHFSMTSEHHVDYRDQRHYTDERSTQDRDTEKTTKSKDQKDQKDQKDKKDKKSDADQKKEEELLKAASQCPEGFIYEAKDTKDQAPFKLEACRMPMSYDLGSGYDHECFDCHYSYGRWLDRCAEHFVRNGCCTCTPHCPEGMVMDTWKQDSHDKNNFVCIIRSEHALQ